MRRARHLITGKPSTRGFILLLSNNQQHGGPYWNRALAVEAAQKHAIGDL
jgi:hypothetical protein